MTSSHRTHGAAATIREQLLMEGLVNAGRVFRHRLWPELERERLTSPMFWALHQVVLDGPMSVGQIAGACVVTSANVSAAVDRLEAAGFVVRRSSSPDRRVVTLTATSRGRAVHRALADRIARGLLRSLDGLPARDLEAAARVLGRLAQPAVEGPSHSRGGVGP